MIVMRVHIPTRGGRVMRIVAAALAVCFGATVAGAQQAIVNGGFEAGPAGWTIQSYPGSNGALTVTPTTTGPISGLPQVGPHSGALYALTDMGGPGAYSLFQ